MHRVVKKPGPAQQDYNNSAARFYSRYANKSTDDWDKDLPYPKLSLSVAALLVAVVGATCFCTSWDGEFVFDDSEAILNNNDLKPEKPWQDVFFNDFWGNKLASNTSHKSYRPLTVLTFRLNYYLADGLHPEGFHIVNIVLHGLVCALLLPVVSILLGGSSYSNHGRLVFRAPRASVLAALLFAVHPIHTECVSGIVGRADLLCAVCVLLALLAYVKAALTDYDGQHESFGTLWLIVCVVLTVTASLCKEQGITVLGLCSAFDILGHHKLDLLALVGLKKTARRPPGPSPCVFPSFQRHVVLFVTGMVIILVRLRLQGGAAPTFQPVDNPHSFVDGRMLRAINYSYLYSLNMWLLLSPSWLCFDWSMGCVPVIDSMADPRVCVALGFWLLIGCLLGGCMMGRMDNYKRSCLLALAFIIIPFLPASNVFFRVGFVIAERILYLPSIGFILLVVIGASRLAQLSPAYSKAVGLLMVLLIGAYSARSVQRSDDWRMEKTLFETGAQVCPLNAKVHYNLGKIAGDANDVTSAVGHYRHALSLHSRYDQAMNNLANILKDQGEMTEAEELLEQAVGIRAEFAAAWMNLAIVQAALKKPLSAETSYKTALQHRKKYPDCYYNLGNLYLDEGRHSDALSAWRNATMLKPTHISAWSNLMLLLDNLGRYGDVDVVATEALQYNPGEASLYYNYANTLGKADKYAQSEENFKKAIQLQPKIAMYYSNMGVLYHRWGKLTKAEEMYREALKLDPNSATTQDYLNRVLKKMQGKS